jgi:mono/diheme cytochrome c family protein
MVKTLIVIVALTLLLVACEKVMRDMYDQPKYKNFRPSSLFDNGASARQQPPGTIEQSAGVLAGTSSGRVGEAIVNARIAAEQAQANPYPITMDFLKHGQERFNIYCAPCHSPIGDGDGMITRRGFPHPPSYHIDRLRKLPDRHFYDVITNGYGIMYSYADRVPPEDRWAITAYIRALQLSQNATLPDAPEDIAQSFRKTGR